MNLEDQVCSFEYAKKLKKIGVKQKSIFWWGSFRNESSPKDQWHNIYEVILSKEEKNVYKERDYLKDKKFYSAFTVAELGDILPRIIHKDDRAYFLDMFKDVDNDWHIKYESYLDYKLKQEYSITEADARAKMLIYLLENGIIKNDA